MAKRQRSRRSLIIARYSHHHHLCTVSRCLAVLFTLLDTYVNSRSTCSLDTYVSSIVPVCQVHLQNWQAGATFPHAVILTGVLGCCRCKRSWVCKYIPGKKASLTWQPPSFSEELLHQYPNSVKLAHQCQVGIEVKSSQRAQCATRSSIECVQYLCHICYIVPATCSTSTSLYQWSECDILFPERTPLHAC